MSISSNSQISILENDAELFNGIRSQKRLIECDIPSDFAFNENDLRRINEDSAQNCDSSRVSPILIVSSVEDDTSDERGGCLNASSIMGHILTSSDTPFNDANVITQVNNCRRSPELEGRPKSPVLSCGSFVGVPSSLQPVDLMNSNYDGDIYNSSDARTKQILSHKSKLSSPKELIATHDHDNVVFKSAGGRSIQPSSASLNRVKAMWNDVLKVESEGSTSKATSITNIEITSEPSYISNPPTASDARHAQHEQIPKVGCDRAQTEPSVLDNALFKLAGGTSVQPPSASLSVRAMWNEIDECCDTSLVPETNSSAEDNNIIFKSAGGRSVKPSSASLNHVKAMWKEVLKVENEGSTFKATSITKCIESSSQPGCTYNPLTAADTNNLEHALHEQITKVCPDKPLTESTISDNVLFKSAAGKWVKPSSASLNHVNAVWNDVLKVGNGRSTPTATSVTNIKSSSQPSTSIPSSAAEALESNLEHALHEQIPKVGPDKTQTETNVSDQALFKSAGGRSVKPSSESLNRVRTMWNEVTDIRDDLSHDNAHFLRSSTTQYGSVMNYPRHVDNVEVTQLDASGPNDETPQEASKLIRSSSPILASFVALDANLSCSRRLSPSKSTSGLAGLKRKGSNCRLPLYEPVVRNSPTATTSAQMSSVIPKEEHNSSNILASVNNGQAPSPVLNCSCTIRENASDSLGNFKTDLKSSGKETSPSQLSVEQMKVMLSELLDDEMVTLELSDNKNEPFEPCKLVNRAPLNRSLDWEEFPDLRSSQAVLLEKADVPRRISGKESWTLQVVEQSMNKVRVKDPSNREHNRPDLPPASFNSFKRPHAANPNRVSNISRPTKRKSDPLASNPTKKSKSDYYRIALRNQQDDLISGKVQIQSSPGIMMKMKEGSSSCKLQSLEHHLKFADDSRIEVKKTAVGVSSASAVDYRFDASEILNDTSKTFTDGTRIADFCLLVLDDSNSAGLDETAKAFLTSPCVNPKCIPDGWIRNHYKWIVWKLASYERTFPLVFRERCLSLENVLLQLKYRYDREIDMAQRSCFKKILEGDAAPDKFICCVSSVKMNNHDEGDSLFEFELTDGWYSILAMIDKEMAVLCKKDVVGVGTKLMVHGAELINFDQGCDPLNVPPGVKLKISTNSVRRVKWFAKMGFASNNTPIPTLLCSVLPNGGLVGRMTGLLVRKYPLIYMCKNADGKTVFRSERSEAVFREERKKQRSEETERIYNVILKEVESKYQTVAIDLVKKSLAKGIENIVDPKILFNVISTADGEYLQSQLSTEQLAIASKYKLELAAKINSEVERQLRSKLQESESNLKVTKMLKVRLMDLFTEKHSLLTIWRPSEEEMDMICENRAFEFFSLVASGTRDKILQLSSHKLTRYALNDRIKPIADYQRTLTPIKAVVFPNFSAAFGEIDVVGVVVLVKLPEQSGGVTIVVLTDLEGHYLSITFWTSLSVFGCEDLMSEGSIISCCNLQWRSVSSHRKIPQVFSSELTSFSIKPRPAYLQSGVSELKSKLEKGAPESLSAAKSHVLQVLKLKDSTHSPCPSSPRLYNSPGVPRRPSTPVHNKLKLLNRYGPDEAPPLSPIPLVVSTRHVFSEFRSPCTPSNKSANKTTQQPSKFSSDDDPNKT